jgi:voltage-gated potassium channel
MVFFITIGQFFRAIVKGLRDPQFRSLFYLVLIILLSGTIFYARVEHWSLVDALYFSVVTLATVGYGDLVPTHPISKIFTIIYILLGIGVLVGFVSTVAQHALFVPKAKKLTDTANGQPDSNNEGQK